jgi:HAD superfamily 5'-nucleotidase-like hydrolase
MTIFTNRVINLRRIKAIGFDMDYTLVRYNTKAFEQLTFDVVKNKLVRDKDFPKEALKLKFNYHKVIRGLVIDRYNGNILKVSSYGKIKQAHHGTQPMKFHDQQALYRGLTIDLNDENYVSIDTSFSLAHVILFSNLVELKDKNPSDYPSYTAMDKEIKDQIDVAHMDGSLKDEVARNLKKYIIQDPGVVKVLKRFKKAKKKLWVITNSDFHYTRLLLDYTINPYLDDGDTWAELFDIVVTSATKPRFFTDKRMFYEIDVKTGYLKNTRGPFTKGIFHGGSANVLQVDNELSGEEILYLGDHIYGDILALKKTCDWRTALVIEELVDEIDNQKKAKTVSKKLEKLMSTKGKAEEKLDKLYMSKFDGKKTAPQKSKLLYAEIQAIDKELSEQIKKYNKYFNSTWGEMMRSGQDPSSLAGQIERYACIYMSKVSDLAAHSPRYYFRPKKRPLSHEL